MTECRSLQIPTLYLSLSDLKKTVSTLIFHKSSSSNSVKLFNSYLFRKVFWQQKTAMWWKLLIQMLVNKTDSYPLYWDCKTKHNSFQLESIKALTQNQTQVVTVRRQDFELHSKVWYWSNVTASNTKGTNCASVLMSSFNMRVCLGRQVMLTPWQFSVVFKLCTQLMQWVIQWEKCPQWKLQYCMQPGSHLHISPLSP